MLLVLTDEVDISWMIFLALQTAFLSVAFLLLEERRFWIHENVKLL